MPSLVMARLTRQTSAEKTELLRPSKRQSKPAEACAPADVPVMVYLSEVGRMVTVS